MIKSVLCCVWEVKVVQFDHDISSRENYMWTHQSRTRGAIKKTSHFFPSSLLLIALIHYNEFFLLCGHKRRRSWIIIFSTCFTFLLDFFITFNCILLFLFFWKPFYLSHSSSCLATNVSDTLFFCWWFCFFRVFFRGDMTCSSLQFDLVKILITMHYYLNFVYQRSLHMVFFSSVLYNCSWRHTIMSYWWLINLRFFFVLM